MKPKYQQFVVIPTRITSSPDLSLGAKVIFGIIHMYVSAQSGYAWPTDKLLREMAGDISKSQLGRILVELEDRRIITRILPVNGEYKRLITIKPENEWLL